jgi:short-subunit dehydrogenase
MNAIITGASKGIGKAIAEKLVLQNCNIAICARDEKQLQETKSQLQILNPAVAIFTMVADLSKKNEAQLFGKQCLENFQTIDILINNAGSYMPGDITTEADGTIEKMIETNLYSAYHLSRIIVPKMQAQMSGHIFNMSSIAGLQAYKNGGAYSISKFALQGFSKNLREELKSYFVKVTTINPGATMSDSWSGSGIEEDRIMKAADIAEVLWNAYQLSKQTVVEDIVLRPILGDL